MDCLKFRQTSKSEKTLIFKEFCNSTSLHGYSHVSSFENIVVKLFWIFVILTMTGLGFFFVASNTNDYFQARLITNIESATADLRVSSRNIWH